MEAWSKGTPWPGVTEAGYSAFRKALTLQVNRQRQQALLNHAANRAIMLAGNLADTAATLSGFLREDREAGATGRRALWTIS